MAVLVLIFSSAANFNIAISGELAASAKYTTSIRRLWALTRRTQLEGPLSGNGLDFAKPASCAHLPFMQQNVQGPLPARSGPMAAG